MWIVEVCQYMICKNYLVVFGEVDFVVVCSEFMNYKL